MTITLQLTDDQERLFEEGSSRRDRELVLRVLTQAVESTVDALLASDPTPEPTTDGFEALSRKLWREFDGSAEEDPFSLGDEALARSAIYQGHP
ncbi:MAG: hypothetical protein KDD47_09680 [Acidobacteria bacterium]|nr:hypothetical protein [Acidobacteriota bacterium]